MALVKFPYLETISNPIFHYTVWFVLDGKKYKENLDSLEEVKEFFLTKELQDNCVLIERFNQIGFHSKKNYSRKDVLFLLKKGDCFSMKEVLEMCEVN